MESNPGPAKPHFSPKTGGTTVSVNVPIKRIPQRPGVSGDSEPDGDKY